MTPPSSGMMTGMSSSADPTTPIRWGVAGTGTMAAAFVADFAHVPDGEVVAIGSRREQSARAFADEHGVERGGTHRDLVEDPDVDVVYVATPHPQHLAVARAAIEAGKPVLVEKAFTATLEGAESLVALARERGVFCMEAMWTRFQPAVVRARELLADGTVGALRMVQADLGAYRTYDPDSRLFDPALGGGALLDLGVYVVSLAQHVLGSPDQVLATGTRFANGADASVALHLGYDDGRAAALVASLESESPGRAVLLGTGGSLELGPRFHHPEHLVLRRNGGEAETIECPVGGGRGYWHQAVAVQECLRAGLTESPVMPLDDTLAVQMVLQTALEQLGIEPAEDPDFAV